MKKTLICTIVAMVLAVSAEASLVNFTHEGNGNGTLGGNPFAASDFVFTAVGDTGDRMSFGNGWWIDHISASVSIDGLGDFDLLTETRTFVNNNSQTVGFSRAGSEGADLFNGPSDAQFATWDMLNPIGPISGLGNLMQWTNIPQIDTTGGVLVFNSSSSYAIFTATPEPATVCLLGLGGLVLRLKKKQF